MMVTNCVRTIHPSAQVALHEQKVVQEMWHRGHDTQMFTHYCWLLHTWL